MRGCLGDFRVCLGLVFGLFGVIWGWFRVCFGLVQALFRVSFKAYLGLDYSLFRVGLVVFCGWFEMHS